MKGYTNKGSFKKGHKPYDNGIRPGKNSPNWQGGISFEPYVPSFNRQLKERVRVRDNFICQVCGIPELECNKLLHIHHIDYNKNNSDIKNLISLCNSCHCKTNFNRKQWLNYFNNKMEVRNG